MGGRRRVRRPGGLLGIETMHRDRLAWLHGQEFDPGSRLERIETDWIGGVNTSTVEIGGEDRRFRFRLYTATDYLYLLTEAGFTEIEAFGGFDGSPRGPHEALPSALCVPPAGVLG